MEEEATSELLPATKAEQKAARREERQAAASDEVSELARQARERRSALAATAGGPHTEDLSRQVTDGVDVILKVATKSGHLKGTFTRALKEAADGIKEAVEVLLNRTASEEVLRMREENGRLMARLEALEGELAAVRASLCQQQARPTSVTAGPPSASMPGTLGVDEMAEIARAVLLQAGGMINARLEALEPRLLPAQTLRPPLAADKRRMEESARTRPAQGAKPAGPPAAVTYSQAAGTKKPAKPAAAPAKSAAATARTATAATKPAPSAAATARPAKAAARPTTTAAGTARGARVTQPATVDSPDTESWTTVTKKKSRKKRGGKKHKKKKSARTAEANNRPPKVSAPRSAAVVITLQPEAVQRGVTYKAVLAEAKAKVQFPDLGTPAGFRFRTSRTGGRVLELPGADSGETADALAAKLREALKPEDVRVSRPVKTAGLRVVGLDDSVSEEEVMEAASKAGGCPPKDVTIGQIRWGSDGSGTVVVRCPVEAANKVAEAGRLLVGWVSAAVKLLKPKAMRCYRCLDSGHVLATCTAEADRSDLCHRCGRPGHKSAQCTAQPNCYLCAAAGRRAGHKAGGEACRAPPASKRKFGNRPVGGAAHPQQPSCPSADSRPGEGGSQEMEC